MLTHIDRPHPDVGPWTENRLTVIGPGEEQLAAAEAAVAGAVQWDGARFDRAPNLRVLARTGIGVDGVDLVEATRRGVQVTNTPDGPTVSTAEHTIALLFSVAKTLTEHQDRLRSAVGGYAGASTAMELEGLTLGLVGFGRIARRVARIAAAVGMEVIANDPYLPGQSVEAAGGTFPLVDFATLLARSDVVSLHAPLSEESAGLMNEDTFERCKRGVIVINAARGGLIDTDALVAALDRGRVGAAGLDVTAPEPLPPEHPLLHRPNVVVTPHVASSTTVGRERLLRMAIEQVLMVADGQRPTSLVNADVLTHRSRSE